VIVCDIDLEGANLTAAEINELGRQAMAAKMDITDSTEVRSVVTKALEQFKAIDILVNNAGAISELQSFVDKPEAVWNQDIKLNLIGTMNCTQAVLAGMLARKSGKIINISSIGAKKGKRKTVGYGAAKAGIIGLTQCLGVEVAGDGINVNCIAPGLGVTNFGGGAPPPDIMENAMNTIPAKRTTTPQDIANMVTILASDVTSNVVGQCISVDGGECIV
jgi:3-oxoacyl-[acyl-carrier protein] reductase